MGYLVSLLVGGLVSGAIYSILAMGLTLSFSTSKIFNFGLGATAFSCAYLFFQLRSAFHLPSWLAALLIAFVFAPVAGLLWDRYVFRRLMGASDAVKIVATIGVLLVMPAFVVLVCNVLRSNFGVHFVDTQSVIQTPGVGPDPPIQWHPLKGMVLSTDEVITLGVSAVLFVGLTLLLHYTRLGLTMRTAVDRPQLARLRGTNTDVVSAYAWVISFVIAGLAGVIAGPIPGFGLNSDNYTLALFVAATAAVYARLRSIPIAFGVGLLIGAATNLSVGYLNSAHTGAVGRWIQSVAGLQSSLPYWALLIGLVVFSVDRGRRGGVASEEAAPPDYLADLPAWRRRLPWIVVGGAFFLYTVGPINVVWRETSELALATAVLFLSYTIVTGIGGMISLAQTAFVTGSGLTLGYLISTHGWPYLPAFIVGTGVAVVLGVIVALPALRLGGIQLALATLALALLGYSVLFVVPSLNNGTTGWTINRPKLGPLDLGHDRVMVVVLWLVLLAGCWLVRNLQESPSGRAMVATRSSEVAAAANGVSPVAIKLSIFGVSALFAGVGGMLLATVNGSIGGQQYPPNPLAFLWLATVVVFGLRRPLGAVLAGIISVFFPAILTSGIHIGHFGWNGTTQTLIPSVLFGGAAVALAKKPDGALSQIAEGRYQKRRKREAERGAAPATQPGIPVASVAAVGADRDDPDSAVARREGDAIVEPPGEPMLELNEVRAGYGEVEVLRGVDLLVPRGSIVAVIGPNGSGKSTLCSVIGGLVPVGAGRITVDGMNVTGMPAHRRAAAGVAVVPESRGIFPSISVEENLALWLRSAQEREEVYDTFPLLGVRRRQLASSLSGGEQQMLSLGSMLVKPPKVLVLDEPTLGIADIISAEIMREIQLIASRGTTVVLTEERARNVMTVAEWVSLIYLGQILWLRPREDVDDDVLAGAYLRTGVGDSGPESGGRESGAPPRATTPLS